MGSLLETPTPPVKPPPADLTPGLNPRGRPGSTVLTAGLNAPSSETAVEQTAPPSGHAPLPPAAPVRATDKGATILTSGLRNRPDGRLRKGADSAAIAARGRDREIDRNRMRANSPSVRRSVGTDMLMGLNNEYLAAQQGTSPVVRRADGAFNYRRAQQREQDLFDEQRVVRDPSRFVVLNDPGTNRLTVFDRSPETDEGGVARMGRLLMLGLATDPIRFSQSGASRAVQGMVRKPGRAATGESGRPGFGHNRPPASTESWASRAGPLRLPRERFASFVTDLFAGRRMPQGSLLDVGTLSSDVQSFVRKRGIKPASIQITVEDRRLRRMRRDTKVRDARALSQEDIKRLPEIIDRPRAVLWDRRAERKGEPALLYVFDPGGPDRLGKIFVRIDFADRRTRQRSNSIRSAGLVPAQNLREGSTYIRISGQID